MTTFTNVLADVASVAAIALLVEEVETSYDALLAYGVSEGYLEGLAKAARRKPEVSSLKWALTYSRCDESFELHKAFFNALRRYDDMQAAREAAGLERVAV